MIAENNGLFISHNHEDKDLVAALKEFIDGAFAHHFEIFATSVDPIHGGKLWHQEIRDNLDRARVVIVLITPRSYNKEWVLFEAGASWLNADTLKKTLIPCRFLREEFPSPLAPFQGVNLESSEEVERILIPSLSSATTTHLHPSTKILQILNKELQDNLNDLREAYPREEEEEEFPQVQEFIKVVKAYFQDNNARRNASDFIGVLKKQNILINQKRYDEFLTNREIER